MKRKVYFITVCEKPPHKNDRGQLVFDDETDIRVMGVYYSIKKAREIVKNNVSDINETIYNYAIIEGVRGGMYPCYIPDIEDTTREVYRFNKGARTYEPISDDWKEINTVIALR